MPLVESGHQIHLLSYKPVDHPWTGLEKLVDLTQLTNLRKLRFAWWGLWIRRYVRRIRPDILHAHQLTGAGWLGAMANYHPFVVSGWGSDILLEPHKSGLRRLLINLVLRRCDALTVPSALMYHDAASLAASEARLHLIPWGIETDIFHPHPNDRLATRHRLSLAPDAKVILCPRGVRRIYNIHIILEAIRPIIRQEPKLRLVILLKSVDEAYLSELKQLVIANELDEFVRWLPARKTPAEMACLYRMADAVVSIPSSEGYGFTVYEALATGCPTIISDLPAFEDELISGIHTLKVPVADIVQTGRALMNLLADETLRQNLHQNGLNIVQGKGSGNRLAQTEALYRQLIALPCSARREHKNA